MIHGKTEGSERKKGTEKMENVENGHQVEKFGIVNASLCREKSEHRVICGWDIDGERNACECQGSRGREVLIHGASSSSIAASCQ